MSNGGLISGSFVSTSGFATSIITTRGQIIRGDSSGDRSAYNIGAASTVLASDGTDPSWTAHSALKIPVALEVACSDEETALTTGTKITFRIPQAMTLNAGIEGARCSLTTAGTGGNLLTVDINEGGSTILSTKLTTDASSTTSYTAATPVVISDTSLADNAVITVDIDQIDSGGVSAGLKIQLIGVLT